MKDKLAEFIDDYNRGRVTIEDTFRRLDFERWKEDKAPLPQDYIELPQDPLDIVLEKERVSTLMATVKWLKQNISDELWRIFCMAARGFTQEKMGRILNISQPTVSRRLQTLRTLTEGNLHELLYRLEKQYTAVHPHSSVQRSDEDESHANGEVRTEKIVGWKKSDAR